MRKGNLDKESILKLQRDKKKGIGLQVLMDKYGIGKTSVFKYAKLDVDNDDEDRLSDIEEDEEEEDDDDDDEENEAITISNTRKKNISDGEFSSDNSGDDDEDYLNPLSLLNNDHKDNKKDNKKEKVTVTTKENKKTTSSKQQKSKPLSTRQKKTLSTRQKKVDVNEEEEEEKEKIIQKIQAYTEQFRDKLENYLPIKKDKYGKYIIGLYKKSLEELGKELDFIRSKLSTSNTKTAFKVLYNTGTNAIEKIGPFIGLKLDGLTEEVTRSKEIDQVLTELSCEYSFNKFMDPKVRLVAHTGFAILKVDSMNKRQEKIQQVHTQFNESLKQDISEEIIDRYKEI